MLDVPSLALLESCGLSPDTPTKRKRTAALSSTPVSPRAITPVGGSGDLPEPVTCCPFLPMVPGKLHPRLCMKMLSFLEVVCMSDEDKTLKAA